MVIYGKRDDDSRLIEKRIIKKLIGTRKEG